MYDWKYESKVILKLDKAYRSCDFERYKWEKPVCNTMTSNISANNIYNKVIFLIWRKRKYKCRMILLQATVHARSIKLYLRLYIWVMAFCKLLECNMRSIINSNVLVNNGSITKICPSYKGPLL